MGASDQGRSTHRVTMTDVAKAAGVSIATATYVLSGKRLSKVSPATQARVVEAARQLGYRPNRVARGLKTQRSYAIGVICSHVGFSLFGAADGHRAMRHVLEATGCRLPLGVYAVNDYAAAGAVRAALEAGLHVPGDVAFVGNDDLEVASRLFPSLTSISQRLDEAGTAAATALLTLLRGEAPEPRYVIQPELIVRESTGGTTPSPPGAGLT